MSREKKAFERSKELLLSSQLLVHFDPNLEIHLACDASDCQQSRPSPPTAPLHPWCWPSRPWTRLHVDFAGPMEGKMFLIVIDAHSKWIEVFPMATATAMTTIQRLTQLFAQFGIPESIVSTVCCSRVSRVFVD